MFLCNIFRQILKQIHASTKHKCVLTDTVKQLLCHQPSLHSSHVTWGLKILFSMCLEEGPLLCARSCGRNEEVTYPLHQRATGRGPLQADSESRSRRWEITVWSKTMSSGSRVSARIASCILRHAEPQSHHSDPVFHWITGLRPHWPLCRYPVTNLPILTSTQWNDTALPGRRLKYRANPAQLLGPEPMYVVQLGRWSEDGEQCGSTWPLKGLGSWKVFSLRIKQNVSSEGFVVMERVHLQDRKCRFLSEGGKH